MIRVFLVDDHELVLDGLKARLERTDNIQVVATATNGQEALEKLVAVEVDLLISDISMPGFNGIELLNKMGCDFPQIKVLLLSMHENKEYILNAMRSGAKGYVLKDVSSLELISGIETIAKGGTYFSSGVSQVLLESYNDLEQQQESQLTQREQSVLVQIADGLCNKEMAEKLSISVRTVETHRLNIKRKLDLSSTAELTRYAIQKKMVKLEQ